MKVEVEIPGGFECKAPIECPLLDWNNIWSEGESPDCYCNLLDGKLRTEHTAGGWKIYKHSDCPSLGKVE